MQILKQMSNMKVDGLSERIVPLTRGFQGPGVKVHQSVKREFLTIYVSEYAKLDSETHNAVVVDCEDNIPTTFKLIVGNSDISLILTKSLNDNTILRNLYVDETQEIWISCSHPNKFCIYGFASSVPTM